MIQGILTRGPVADATLLPGLPILPYDRTVALVGFVPAHSGATAPDSHRIPLRFT
jgi:hypothetical protein